MDIQMIATRTGLPLRKLRYVLDHRLLPGLRIKLAEDQLGQPRKFTDFEGFGIAAAAALLEGGAKRDTVTSFLEALSRLPSLDGNTSGRTFLFDAFHSKLSASAALADQTNIRARLGQKDTGWVQPKTWAALKGYEPLAIVSLQLDLLRHRLQNHLP